MRILVLDGSAEERRVVADQIRKTFPEADIPGEPVLAGSGDGSLIDGAVPGADNSWTLDRDIPAAARFPIENPNPVLRFGRDGKVLFANRASKSLLVGWGVAQDGYLPETWRQVLEEVLASGQPASRMVPYEDKVIALDLVPVPDTGYVNIYGRDITVQRAEREVLKTIMEHTRVQLAYLDPQFNFVSVNSAYAGGSGQSKEQLIGRNHFDLFPNPENRAIFERVRDSRQGVEFQAKPFRYADQPERGTTYWDWTLTPVWDGEGPVKGLVLSLLDVTDRVRAQKLRDALNSIDTSINSALDYSQIVRRVIAEASAALDCDSASLVMRENDHWHLSEGYGHPVDAIGQKFAKEEGPYAALASQTRDVFLVEDALHDPRIGRELAKAYGVGSFMAVPLAVHDQVMGAIFFNYTYGVSFTEAEVDFARKLAASVSLALANARLVAELEQRVQERTAELEAIFDSLPDAVYVGNTQGITRCNQTALDILGCTTIEDLHDKIPNLAEKIRNRFVDTGERIPAAQEPFVRALNGEHAVLEMVQRNLKTGQDVVVRSACAPIVRNDQVIGAVAVNTDITARRRMEEELRSHDEQLRAYSRRMMDMMENERRAIARELHDEAGQALTSLMVGIGLLQRDKECPPSFGVRLVELKQTTDAVLDSLRRLAMDLRPGVLDKAGLVPAVRQYADAFRQQTGLEVEFVDLGLSDRHLPARIATNLYRMVQEALTNVSRHSHADHVGIVLQNVEGRIVLLVEDNGDGFDLREAQQKGHLGLLGIRERAEILDGSLQIETTPGQGTTLYVEVPYRG